jgi:hypothetical protein
MKFTQVPADTFKEIQLNAGIILKDFDPATGTLKSTDIVGATSGGVSFAAEPEFVDFGEDIDNVPNNTKELKRLDSITAIMSGEFVSMSADMAKLLAGAADVSDGKVVPRADLATTDFQDIWWVGDYSDKNGDTNGGFIAIKLLNALSTGGFQIQSTDREKGKFEFEFTGHYSIDAIETVPYEIYVKQGTDEAA